MVMVPIGAVSMSVRDFLGRRGAYIEHRAIEAKPLPGEFVIAIQHCLAVGDSGNAPDNFGTILFSDKMSANRQVGRQIRHRLNADQLGIVFAERVHGLHRDGDGVADLLPVQGLFDLGKDA